MCWFNIWEQHSLKEPELSVIVILIAVKHAVLMINTILSSGTSSDTVVPWSMGRLTFADHAISTPQRRIKFEQAVRETLTLVHWDIHERVQLSTTFA